MKTYSTKEAAELIGVHWVTLLNWIRSGKVRPSQHLRMNGATYWRWTDSDIAKTKAFKAANYRQGRWRRK